MDAWARRRAVLDTVAATACVAAIAFVAVGAPPAARLVAVLGLFTLAPGAAIVPLVQPRSELGLVVATSLATVAVVAQGMLWLGFWHPHLLTYGLAFACLAVVGPRAARAIRGAP